MTPRRTRIALLIATLGALSCASERAPINRVQANALEKAFFVGESLADTTDDPEFYYRPTVADVDYGAAQNGLFTASYAQSMARIKWEITEDLLIGRLTYERVADTTGNGSPDDNAGQIVTAFSIQSHFDVQRAYNPQTGEELNIIEENTTDRPWYERAFMRVDWSQNLITGAYELDTVSALKIFADQPLRYEPVAYYVEDPQHADAPVFSPDEGYFDITNKLFVTPELLDTPYGVLPACWFSPDYPGGQYPTGNCNPTEVKIRLSFRRVTDTDYAPVNWDGVRMDMVGMFTSGTSNASLFGYDRKYGLVDEKWYRLASRLNIWQASHAVGENGNEIPCYTEATTPAGSDPNRDFPPNGTEDECESAGAGSRCDRYMHACTIPYRSREIRVNPYFYGPDSDPTLFGAVSNALLQWDEALRHAVQTARYTECIRVTQFAVAPSPEEIAACKELFPPSVAGALEAVPQILTLCHNPVIEGDHPACGLPGTKARVGDLRYHMANVIQNPQAPSFWGILADAVDPLTGEVIAASVNMWNAQTDMIAQTWIDQMRWYLGELSSTDVIVGNYLAEWVTADKRAARALPSGGAPLLSTAQVEQRVKAMDRRLSSGATPTLPAGLNQRGFVDWASDQVRQTFGDQVLGSGNSGREARLAMARDSEVESALLTAPYLAMAGLDPATPVDETTLNAASPLRGNMARFKLDLERQRHNHLAQIGRCMLQAPEPSSVIDLAKVMNEKFPIVPNANGDVGPEEIQARNQKWHDYLRKRLTYGVMEHELGHSMGLRHVFTGSYDALNFRPQYWQLRTRDGAETETCTGPTSDGSTCVGPRYYDPVTQAERDGMLWMWEHTTVMDYPGDMTQDMLGIGAYDRAAIRFAYADVADVWDEPESVSCVASGDMRNCTAPADVLQGMIDSSFGGIGGPWYGFFTEAESFHYSELQNHFGLVRNCQPADTSPPADWNTEEDGNYHPVLDGHIVNGTVCETPPVDYVSYTEMQLEEPGFAQQYGIFGGAVRKYDALGRVRRPYMFASDEYADIGNVSVLRHDNGADPFEVAHFLISDYEDRHLWDNYRRNRSSFSLKAAYMRGLSRYNAKLLEIGKSIALYNELYQGTNVFDLLAVDRPPTDASYIGKADGMLKPAALASSLIFDHFARMLTRPSNGSHFIDDDLDPNGRVVLRPTVQAYAINDPPQNARIALVVPDGSTGIGVDVAWGGRPVNNSYDGSKGYYALQYDAFVGSYYDKTIAIDLLTETVDRFVDQSRDDFVDGRYRNLSFASLFPDGVRRLIATALTDDSAMLGWQVSSTGSSPNIADGTGFPTQPFGFRSWWPSAGPQVCWPFEGRVSCTEWPSGTPLDPSAPAASVPIDPELGFEVQKFIIFYALLNLPENWKTDWVDMMRIYKVGFDVDPELEDQIAWVDPVSAQVYIAHRYGPEVIDGQSVERGIAGRMISWMNTLTKLGYEVASEDPVTGALTYNKHLDDSACPPGITYCAGDSIQTNPRFAIRAKNYKTLLDFMHTVVSRFGFGKPDLRGVAD